MKIILTMLLLTVALAGFGQTNESDAVVVPMTSGGDLDLFTAMFKQMVSGPAAISMIVVWSIFAFLWDNSSLNSKLIPWITTVGGSATYWLFSSRATVHHDFPYPVAVLVANGFACGFLAWAVGFKAVKNFVLARFKADGEPKEPTK